MKHFYSLSKYPGTTGETYYRKMFKHFDLPYTYTALACDNLVDSVKHMRDIGAAGFSVSMPFKKDVIDLLDNMHPYTCFYYTCNTVVNDNGRLIGYNTDYNGAKEVLKQVPLLPSMSGPAHISILGDGCMGKMFSEMMHSTVYSRKEGNWSDRDNITGVVVNCTSYGTSTYESPFSKLPSGITHVIDLAINSNQLKDQCNERNIKYIPGTEFYRNQFMQQFEIYTGCHITMEDIEKYD